MEDMKKPFCCIFLFFFLLTGCQAQNPYLDKTKEEAEIYYWDFGKVKTGVILSHDFIVRNNSQHVMHIKEITTSCGCAVPEIAKKVLSPGESTSMAVNFNTAGYTGESKQYVYVNTDSPDNPILRFTIRAEMSKD
ncbi:MAG: DUF1573 domain-containing protein [Candidatus Omnitrophota bacterium]